MLLIKNEKQFNVSSYINNIKYRFQLYSETWENDAFELIDYENDKLIQSNLETREPGYITIKLNSIQFTPKLINDDETQNLFEIQCDEERFQIIPNSFEINHDSENESLFKSLNTSWFIFKSNKTIEKPKNYKLNEGDILKIGRMTVIIREIKNNNNTINNNNINYSNKNDISYNTNVNIKEKNFI